MNRVQQVHPFSAAQPVANAPQNEQALLLQAARNREIAKLLAPGNAQPGIASGLDQALKGFITGRELRRAGTAEDQAAQAVQEKERMRAETIQQALAAALGRPAQPGGEAFNAGVGAVPGGLSNAAQPAVAGDVGKMAQILAGYPGTADAALSVATSQLPKPRVSQLLTPAEYEQQIGLYGAQNESKQKKTVNVNGRVRILNPDGTLGADLGREERFQNVQGIGVLDLETNKYLGGDGTPTSATQAQPTAAPQQNQTRWKAPPSPYANLPPLEQSRARQAEFSKSLDEIADLRKGNLKADKMAKSAARFEELMTVQGTGGLARQIPGVLALEGAIDPEIGEMNQILDEMTPLMRGDLPGAASDRDVSFFRGASFGPGKLPQVNRNVILGAKVAAQNIKDQASFKEAYLSKYGTLRESSKQWDEYLKANPIFDPNSDPKSPRINESRQSWESWFNNEPTAPTTGFTLLPPGRKIK